MKAKPPPDEKTVKSAVLRVLREEGLEPQDAWVSVCLVNWPRARVYTVIIAYQPAKVALARVLRRHINNAEKNPVGVWVLDESEARGLCDSTVAR